MPDDSIIRIRQVIDTSGLKAGMAESRAIVAQQLGEVKVLYANATLAAKAAVNDLKSAEVQLGKFAAAGSAEAAAALEGYRAKVAETAAEQVRLGGVLEATKAQFGQGVAAGAAWRGWLAAMVLARDFAAARVEAGVLTGSTGTLDMGLARLAMTSTALGPIMQAALPVAIFAAFVELMPRAVAGIEHFADALRGLEAQFRTAMDSMEESDHQIALNIKGIEAQNKAHLIGAEGQRKLSIETAQNAAMLRLIGPMYREATRDVYGYVDAQGKHIQGYIDMKEKLEAFIEKAGPWGVMYKDELDKVNKLLAESKKTLSELEPIYVRLRSEAVALPRERAAEAEKESLAMRLSGLRTLGEFERDNYAIEIERIRAGAEEVRRDRDNQIAAAQAVFDRKGELAAQIGVSETDIANRVLQATLAANKAALDAEMDRQEQIKALALERGARTGANVQPEINEATAAELHAQTERGQRDMAAWDAAYKAWAKDAKESGDAVTRVLADVARAEMEDSRRTMEEAKKRFDQNVALIKEEARVKTDAAKADLDERLRTMNLVGGMNLRRAQQEIAIIRNTAAEEVSIEQAKLEKLKALGVATQVDYQKYQDRRVEIAREATRKILEIEKQEFEQAKKIYDQLMGDFNTALNQMITHQKTAAQAMAQMWNAMVMDIIKDIEKWIEEMIFETIIMKALQAIFGVPAGPDMSQAAQNAALAKSFGELATAQVVSEAVAAVPFPLNVPVAIAAGAAIAAAASSGGAAVGQGGEGSEGGFSFQHGGVVPGPVGAPVGVTAHGGEMYLGTRLSQTVQNMAAGGGATRAGASNVRINVPTTFVLNHPITESDVRTHGRTIGRIAREEMQRFNS